MFILLKTETRPILPRTQTRDEIDQYSQRTDKPRVYKHPMEDYIRQLKTSTKLNTRSIQSLPAQFCSTLVYLSQRPQTSLQLKIQKKIYLRPIKPITPSTLVTVSKSQARKTSGSQSVWWECVGWGLRRWLQRDLPPLKYPMELFQDTHICSVPGMDVGFSGICVV